VLASLYSLSMAAQTVDGRNLPVKRNIGEGKDSQASEWIIAVVDRPDPRPG